MPNLYHPHDSRLVHRALASAALTSATVLATIDERVAQRTCYLTRVVIEALGIATNDETYQLVIEVSNASNFATLEVAAILDLGATEVRQSGAPDNVAGDAYEIMWSTEVKGVKHRYWRAKLFMAGTAETMTLGCWSTILPGI